MVMLLLWVFGSDGLLTHNEQFDLDREDAARARLDELTGAAPRLLYADGAKPAGDRLHEAEDAGSARRAELTRIFCDAFAARDWDTLATLLAPDLVVRDHRTLGWETLHGPYAYVQALRSLVDLAPDVCLRIDHMSMSDRAALYATTWLGSHQGGAFETPSVIVCELDGVGRIRGFDTYDPDQIEEARARLGTIGRDRMPPAD